MPEDIRDLLVELKAGLIHLYGKRLRGVYIFGSYARGDQDNESDLDVMIVLNRFKHYGKEIDYIAELVSSLSLQYGVSVSTIFVGEREWLKDDTPLLRNVRTEAIRA